MTYLTENFSVKSVKNRISGDQKLLKMIFVIYWIMIYQMMIVETTIFLVKIVTSLREV